VSDTITWDSRSGTENKIPKLEIHTTTHNAHKYSDAKTTTEWPTGHRARDIIVFGQSAKTRKTKCCTINGIRFATISHFKFRFLAIFDQQNSHKRAHVPDGLLGNSFLGLVSYFWDWDWFCKWNRNRNRGQQSPGKLLSGVLSRRKNNSMPVCTEIQIQHTKIQYTNKLVDTDTGS